MKSILSLVTTILIASWSEKNIFWTLTRLKSVLGPFCRIAVFLRKFQEKIFEPPREEPTDIYWSFRDFFSTVKSLWPEDISPGADSIESIVNGIFIPPFQGVKNSKKWKKITSEEAKDVTSFFECLFSSKKDWNKDWEVKVFSFAVKKEGKTN